MDILSVTKASPALRPIIDGHVWISWNGGTELSEVGVIDVTADQAEGHTLPPYIVATYAELIEVLYTAHERFMTVLKLL